MAKQAVYDYSTTASSNSDFDGTDSSGATGKVKDGDNYARSIASHIKGFANDLGGINTVAGTGDAITITLSAAPSALVDGMRLTFNASAANTTNVTLNVTPAGGAAFGSKKVLKWAAGVETALSANDIPAANALIELIYDTARDTAAGAWMLLGTSVAAATTSASGIVELATVAEALTGTDAVRAVTPAGLYYPTGHLFGLTLSTNAGDATNDIDIAAGTARDSTDSFNYVVASAIGKQLDVAWALGGTPGTTTGGLDTGAVGNSRYAIWGIGRSDTQVRNALFSLSFTAPTMPTNYDYKVLLGEVTRAGGVNGPPMWYGPKTAADTAHLGGLKLLTWGAVSSSAALSIVLTSYTGYRGLIFELINFIPATDGTTLNMKLSTDGGGTFASSGYAYGGSKAFSDSGSAVVSGAAQASISLCSSVGNGAAEGTSASIKLGGQANGAIKPRLSWQASTYDAGDVFGNFIMSGGLNTAQDTDAVQFAFSSGNIASGNYAVYGYV